MCNSQPKKKEETSSREKNERRRVLVCELCERAGRGTVVGMKDRDSMATAERWSGGKPASTTKGRKSYLACCLVYFFCFCFFKKEETLTFYPFTTKHIQLLLWSHPHMSVSNRKTVCIHLLFCRIKAFLPVWLFCIFGTYTRRTRCKEGEQVAHSVCVEKNVFTVVSLPHSVTHHKTLIITGP